MQKWSNRWVYLAVIPLWIYCFINNLNNIYLGLGVLTASMLITEAYMHLLIRRKESIEQINVLKIIWNRFIPLYLYGSTLFIIFIKTSGNLTDLDKLAIGFASGFGLLSLVYKNIDIRSIFAFRTDKLVLNEVVWKLAYNYFAFTLLMLMTSSIFITYNMYVMYSFIGLFILTVCSTSLVVKSYYSKRPK